VLVRGYTRLQGPVTVNMFRISHLRGGSGALAVILAWGAVAPPAAEARTRKGDKLVKQGRVLEEKKDFDAALEYFEQALLTDSGDAGYRILVQRTRFYASQKRLNAAQKLRDEGNLEQALAEFMKAIQLDPSSSMAIQEWKRTQEMIEREKTRGSKPGERGLTPAQMAQKEIDDRIGSLLAPPELKPVNRVIQSLKMNSQPPRVLYETLCKLAGLNVVFDPQYQNTSGRQNYNVELNNSTVENALDYLGVLTKTFWKPLTENTVFVAEDNVTKRRDYDDDVVKVFYVANATSVQEFQEIATAIRSLTEIRRVYTYNAQKALLIRGTVDQVALAEKLIRDLDKPKAEVVVDVIVMEANRGRTRDLASTIMSGTSAGLKLPVTFSPRSSLATGTTSGDDDTPSTSTAIRLSNIGKVDVRDFTTTLPGALLSAILTDRSTRVLQSPQVRASDGQKVSLRIGDKIPIATGSFQPGIGGVGGGVSPLVSTQFNFTEVGVNVDMTPQVHGTEEVTLKVSVEVSTVRDRVDLGGISQPVIGQRKSETELRLREGEVNILGGLTNAQDSRLVSGIPGIVNVPVLGRLFGSENVERNQQELLIALVPHIVRTPGYSVDNLRAIYAGTDQLVRVSYAPKAEQTPTAAPKPQTPAVSTPPPVSTAPAAPQPSGGAAVLNWAPGGEIQAAPGSVLNLSLQISNVQDLFAVNPIRIKYDASRLKLNDVTQGDLLGRDGQRVQLSKDIRNDSGEATITLTRLPGATGVTGSGALLQLSFQGMTRGSAVVVVEELSLKNPQLQGVAAGPPQAVTIRLQ
jgi:general secretion pathway protein D